MAQRLKIGLIYSYSDKWIAGAYYIENLISALKTLNDGDKPSLIIYTNSVDYQKVLTLGYPYIQFRDIDIHYSIMEKIVNVFSRSFTKKNFFEKRPKSSEFDYLFPVTHLGWMFDLVKESSKIYWIPDFQEHYFPEFFQQEEIIFRKQIQTHIAENAQKVVFSSFSAQEDFKKIYPQYNKKTYVLNFAVTHPDYQEQDITSIRLKYAIPKEYFFCPNQFWMHKNQIVILKAIKILKEKGHDYFVAFSGKQEDYRNPEYFNNIQKYVEENQLQENIKFLGFIDRKEQLALMKYALAVLQPSLFEGWSTVIEDAKSMNQWVIASDITVHREQIKNNVHFFNPHDELHLSEKIYSFITHQPQKTDTTYADNVRKFGKDFMEIVK
jgi:glycosyltransferase involved in cell wall biosynthesis